MHDCFKGEYADKYPHIIKPILQTENQWSKKDGSIGRIMSAHTRGKYLAVCEGDDFWTDPLKLQRQVDFLENHPEYSLTCTNACVLGLEGDLNWKRYDKDCEIPISDVILKRGAWIYTASMLISEFFSRSSVYRIGGDEFAVILQGEDYEERAELLAAFDHQAEENLRSDRVVVASGMAEYRPGVDKNFRDVFERADKSMYQRKRWLKQHKPQ